MEPHQEVVPDLSAWNSHQLVKSLISEPKPAMLTLNLFQSTPLMTEFMTGSVG
jgi:hypothetical protein